MSKVFTCFHLSVSWINKGIDIPAKKYTYIVQIKILFSVLCLKINLH